MAPASLLASSTSSSAAAFTRAATWSTIDIGAGSGREDIGGSLLDAILMPERLDALAACDHMILSYDVSSFALIFRCRGRNLPFVLKPMLIIFVWGVIWAIIFQYHEAARSAMLPLADLVTPMLTPVSFLLVFRLGRAAVRWWDARAAAGKLVEASRLLASSGIISCESNSELVDGLARWTCIFPIAVKNFLRPSNRPGWETEARLRKQRFEVGALLSDAEADAVLQPRDGFGPIVVLNHLRKLAFRASKELDAEVAVRATVFRLLNAYIDTLCGAWGAMERINATPLPFAYVVHLRTFLIIYLLGWHLDALATHSWVALAPLTLVSWALLGIEAASVECERPFRWEANHLALGKMCSTIAKNVGQTLEACSSSSASRSALASAAPARQPYATTVVTGMVPQVVADAAAAPAPAAALEMGSRTRI